MQSIQNDLQLNRKLSEGGPSLFFGEINHRKSWAGNIDD